MGALATTTPTANAVPIATGGGKIASGWLDLQAADIAVALAADLATGYPGNVIVDDGANIVVSATTGTKVASATTQKLGFWNATPIVQPASASQAAVGVTAATSTTPFGYTTQAQADGIVTLLNEIRAALVAAGLIKGSA